MGIGGVLAGHVVIAESATIEDFVVIGGGGGAAVAPTDRGGNAAGSAEKSFNCKRQLETLLVTNESVDVSK